MAKVVDFALRGDIRNLADQLGKVPGITDKNAKLMVASLEREMRRAEKSSRAAAKGAEHAWAKSGENAGKGIEKGLKALGGPLGSTADLVFDLGESFAMLASPVGLVVTGLVATGIAAAGSVAGVGALGVGLVAAAVNAEAALEKLEGFKEIDSDFYPMVPPETLASMHAMATVGDALTSIWAKFTVDVGSNTAPTLEYLGEVLVGTTLQGEEMFGAWSRGTNLLEEFATFGVGSVVQSIGGPLVGALRLPLAPLALLTRGLLAVSEATGREIPEGLKATLEGIREFDTSLATLPQKVTEGVVAMGEEALASLNLGDRFDALADKGRSFIDVQDRATKAMEKGAAAAKELTFSANVEALDAQVAAIASASKRAEEITTRALEGELDAVEKVQKEKRKALEDYGVAAAEAQYTAARIAKDTADIEAGFAREITRVQKEELAKRTKEAADAAEKTADMQRRFADQVAGYAIQGLSMMSSGFKASYENATANVTALAEYQVAAEAHLTEAQQAALAKRQEAAKKAAEKSFRNYQMAEIGKATMGTAQAFVSALDDAPYPANLVLAGLSAAAGVVQIGTIAGQKPSFEDTPGPMQMDTGGSVRLAGGDYFAAAKDPNELRRQVGAKPEERPMRIEVRQVYRHQEFNRFARDGIRIGNPITELVGAGTFSGDRTGR